MWCTYEAVFCNFVKETKRISVPVIVSQITSCPEPIVSSTHLAIHVSVLSKISTNWK